MAQRMVAGVFRRVYTGMVKYRYIPVYTRFFFLLPSSASDSFFCLFRAGVASAGGSAQPAELRIARFSMASPPAACTELL